MDYHIDCPLSDTAQEHAHDDYHPLTEEAVAFLLRIAQLSDNNTEINSVHSRLRQGIRGMTCPGPTDGDVADRHADLSSLFAQFHFLFDARVLAHRLYAIMEGTHGN